MLFCDVTRWPHIEIHTGECRDVDKAIARKLLHGTIEGENAEHAIANYIENARGYGSELTRECFRVMPCVKKLCK